MDVGLAGALLVGLGKRPAAESLVLKEVLPEGWGLEEAEVLLVDEAPAEVGVFLPLEKEFVGALRCSPYFRLTFYFNFPQTTPIVVAKIQQSTCYDGKSTIELDG